MPAKTEESLTEIDYAQRVTDLISVAGADYAAGYLQSMSQAMFCLLPVKHRKRFMAQLSRTIEQTLVEELAC